MVSGCSPTGSAPSSESSTGTFSPVAAPPATETSGASEASTAEDGGELVFAATADDRHSWITAEARVTGVTRAGTCEYTASAEGVDTITRTAKALSSNYDTVCGDISFELGTPGTYTVTVTVTGVTSEPLTGSTEVEFLGSTAG
ncbi:hypothetical protein C5E05_10700 [Pseudoclavibacter sp. AY1H1]|nr:hypothetical protein C5E05_10700 [Pseudoclavibacter sp. AY1H1]